MMVRSPSSSEGDSPTSCNGKESFGSSSPPSPISLSSPSVERRESAGEVGQEKREE